MTSIVDIAPYPWHESAAVALHETLCQIYPAPKRLLYVTDRVGVDAATLNPDQPAFDLWRDVLKATATARKTRTLVTLVRELNPDHPRRGFLDDLLADRPTAIADEGRRPDGSPAFDDRIAEHEALLFHDDLTLSVGRVGWLIGVLERLVALAPAVCRLECNFGGAVKHGTAFRIGGGLLLTNWHNFFHAGARAAAATVDLGYEDDASGHGLSTTAYRCVLDSLVADEPDDWAVIRVAAALPDEVPIIELARAASPIERTPAFLIQHPGGARKRIGYVRNTITSVDDGRLYYLTDTQAGSSGAPVFDEHGQLIGLHHAGGYPQEVAGKPPLKKNEGIRIPRILEGMASKGIDVSGLGKP